MARRRELARQEGLKLIPGRIRALHKASGVQVKPADFITPEETLVLREGFFENVKKWHYAHYPTHWRRDEIRKVALTLQVIAGKVGSKRAVLLSHDDNLSGAVRLPADRILKRFMHVWEIVGQDLCLTTEDLGSGLCLEVNYTERFGAGADEGIYELTVWGDFAIDARPPLPGHTGAGSASTKGADAN